MNIIDFNEKIRELIKNLDIWIIKECQRLAESGGIDLTGAEENYKVPKIILSVALKNASHEFGGYGSFIKAVKKEINNLSHF